MSQYRIKEEKLWISDREVKVLFEKYQPIYELIDGVRKRTADGIFVEEKRTHEGTLGLVYYDPLSSESWLWAIHKKTRRPFKLAQLGKRK